MNIILEVSLLLVVIIFAIIAFSVILIAAIRFITWLLEELF